MQERRILAYIDTNDIPNTATTDINEGDTFNTLYLPIVSTNYDIKGGLSTISNGPHLWIGTLSYNSLFMSYWGLRQSMSTSRRVQKYINGTYYALGVVSNNAMATFSSSTSSTTDTLWIFAPTHMNANGSSLSYSGVGAYQLGFLGYIKLTFDSTVTALSTVNLSNMAGLYPIYIDNE